MKVHCCELDPGKTLLFLSASVDSCTSFLGCNHLVDFRLKSHNSTGSKDSRGRWLLASQSHRFDLGSGNNLVPCGVLSWMGNAVIKMSLPLFFSGGEHSANISTRAFHTAKPFANTLFIPLPELYPSPSAPVANKLYMQGILCHYALFCEPVHWKLKCLKKRERSTGNKLFFFLFFPFYLWKRKQRLK